MIAVLLVAFVVLLLASVPIAIAMGAASLVAVLVVGQIPPMVIVQRMYSGVDSFVLLAVPLFILAGSLMETGGISARLVQLARVLVGHVRGGLGMVVMVAEYLFSGLSGSAAADVSAIGSLLVPAMVKAGYSKPDSVSIVSAASAMGILVPPCIQMIVIASITGSSIAALFMAGFLPAMVMAAMLMALVYALARMNDWPADAKATLGQIVRATLGALIPLGMPIIIFGCIFLGVTTPTEAGALAVVYALVVGRFVYGELQWKDLPGIFARCAITTAAVSLLIATSSAFAWLMAMQYVPNMLLDWFHAISDSPTVFMLLSAAAFILLGAVLEGIPALLILLPTSDTQREGLRNQPAALRHPGGRGYRDRPLPAPHRHRCPHRGRLHQGGPDPRDAGLRALLSGALHRDARDRLLPRPRTLAAPAHGLDQVGIST